MASTSWQPSLLGLGDPVGFDPTFRDLERTDLGDGAWLERLPTWLRGHQEVFEVLAGQTRWQQGRRMMYERMVDVPRLTGSLPADGPGHPVIAQLAAALGARYGVPFDRLSLAYYRDGRDSVAMHGDMIVRDSPDDSVIAIVSVGERRRFAMRANDGRATLGLTVGWGDLLVMGGSCQRTWVHGVPKVTRPVGPRVAIMFRSSAHFGPREEGLGR